MSDLIDELRTLAETNIAASNRTLTAAADALESQAKRIAELEPQADAYNFACEDMEKFQRERFEAGKEVGTQGSLCDGMAWVYGRLSELEAEVARLRVDGLTDNDRVIDAVSWVLCLQDGCDEDSARTLVWQGNPPEPYGEVWHTYAHKAREVLKAAAHKAREVLKAAIDAAKESA